MTDSIVDAALDALSGGHRVQSEVREYIEGSVLSYDLTADSIASKVSDFRGKAQVYIDGLDSEDDRVKVRKITNNICNDISRICRQELGHSIVCKSRKNHTYEAREWTLPKFTKPAPRPPGTLERQAALINDYLLSDPDTAIEVMIKHHGVEKIARLTSGKIKALRGMITTQSEENDND